MFSESFRSDEDHLLSKKPTDFMVNAEELARRLSRRCPGDHEHRHLVGGVAVQAQKYPKELCSEMVKGAAEAQAWLGCLEVVKQWSFPGDREETEAGAEAAEDAVEVQRLSREDEAGAEDAEDAAEDVEDGSNITESDKRLLQKLHSNLGHPGNAEFSRALRMARARGAVWRYVKSGRFQCPTCARNPRQKSARPAMLPRTFQACATVGVDVVYFPDVDVQRSRPVLNMVDWGTGYQMLEALDNTTSEHIWERFFASWVRTFSVPEITILDQGREFSKTFASRVSEAGSLLRVIGARAPWQQGRTERHGGLAKEIFQKVREEMLPTTEREWKECLHAVEAAKNRLFNRSGFSPAQRQLGYNLRIPGSLTSDDVYDPQLLHASAGAEMSRTMQIRQSAMENFIRHTTQRALSRAENARARVVQNLTVGEVVYVYRVPLQRRRPRSERALAEDEEGRKPMWVGPGTIVMVEGANAWVSMRGELWKCAQEQIRRATVEEAEARELLQDEFEELQRSLSRGTSKRGFRDITSWSRPAMADEAEEEGPTEPPARRQRLEETGAPEEPSQSSSSSRSISTEPAEEPPSPARVEQIVREGAEAVHRNEQMDGTLRGRSVGDMYGPIRREVNARLQPYREEDEDEDEATLLGRADDGWIYDEQRRSIIRKHGMLRSMNFKPNPMRGCPVPLKFLSSSRRTVQCFADGTQCRTMDNWRRASVEDEKTVGGRQWTGYTEFFLQRVPAEVSCMVKRGSDEVRDEDIPPEEWEGWRVADAAEWSKVAATGAVRVMDVAESTEVEKQLSEAGIHNRILPSRVVRRWKPAEQPGEKPSRKSRWCIRGDQDPDLLYLDRHAPTVCRWCFRFSQASNGRHPLAICAMHSCSPRSCVVRRAGCTVDSRLEVFQALIPSSSSRSWLEPTGSEMRLRIGGRASRGCW